MTAVKVAFRLKAPDLAFGESFQARHQARIDRPIDDLDLAEFFKDVRASSDSGLNRFKRGPFNPIRSSPERSTVPSLRAPRSPLFSVARHCAQASFILGWLGTAMSPKFWRSGQA
jgi:hypothetical protein